MATLAKIGFLLGEVGRELSETKDDSATYRMNRKKRKVKRRRKKRRRKKRRSKKRRRKNRRRKKKRRTFFND